MDGSTKKPKKVYILRWDGGDYAPIHIRTLQLFLQWKALSLSARALLLEVYATLLAAVRMDIDNFTLSQLISATHSGHHPEDKQTLLLCLGLLSALGLAEYKVYNYTNNYGVPCIKYRLEKISNAPLDNEAVFADNTTSPDPDILLRAREWATEQLLVERAENFIRP